MERRIVLSGFVALLLVSACGPVARVSKKKATKRLEPRVKKKADDDADDAATETSASDFRPDGADRIVDPARGALTCPDTQRGPDGRCRLATPIGGVAPAGTDQRRRRKK